MATTSAGALAQAEPVAATGAATVAAAADLKFALDEVARRFQADTGRGVRLVFGSSGNLATQIVNGAPFHLFMSADEALVFRLADSGRTEGSGRLYAVGRIGLLVPHGSPVSADGELRGLAQALKEGRVRKFAIANPEHAPYGARAKEALEHAGLWAAIEPRLVFGENVAQAAQFATSGSAQGGIVALSLARSPAVEALGTFALVPEQWHRPLRQRMVLLNGAPEAARAFYDYLATPAAQAVMARWGFAMPKD
jgi:molybdate transport system substrate-binding protein